MLLCLACADVSWATIVVNSTDYTVLGRQTGASHVVSLNHPSTPKLLSRQHCSLQLRPDGLLEVTDLNSVNGTFIAKAVADDGIGQHQVQRLQPHIPHVLEPGSTLMLGGVDAVMGVHGQVVSNPFVFLVCGGATAGSIGSEDAAAAAAAGRQPQGQGKPKLAAGTSAGPAAASIPLEQQWAECQQQQHQQQGSTAQPKQQQQQQQPSSTDQQVLQHREQPQQQREPPNSPGVRAVSALLPLTRQQCNQSNSMAQMHDRSGLEYTKPALQQQQQHSCQHTDLPPCPSRPRLQPCVVGVVEPLAKRHCVLMPAPPHSKQCSGQQQLAPPGAVHSPPAQFTSQQPAAATPTDTDSIDSPTGSLQSFQQAADDSGRAGGAAARGTDRPAGSRDAPPSVALAAAAAESCSCEEQLHSPGVSTAAGRGACEPALPAALAATAAGVAAPGAADSSSRRDVRNVSASNLDCTICRELLVATHTLACGHMFCGPCLAQWLEVQAHPSCPSCRTAVESAPVRVYLFDKIVAEAALTSGSEPQEMAARLEMWNAIKEDTAAQWHSKFGSSNTSKHVQGAAAGPQLGPHTGASSRRAVRQRQGHEELPEALQLRRGDVHLLTGLRHPSGVAAAATGATAAPDNVGVRVGRSDTPTAPRPRHKHQGSRHGRHLAQQRHSSTSARGAQMQQRSAAAASRQANQLRGVGSSVAQQRNGTAINGINQRPPSTAVTLGDPARPLRQTAIDAFIQ